MNVLADILAPGLTFLLLVVVVTALPVLLLNVMTMPVAELDEDDVR